MTSIVKQPKKTRSYYWPKIVPQSNVSRNAHLQQGGLAYELRIVSNGEEAMDYLLHRPPYEKGRFAPRPHLLLLDLNMPKSMGGKCLQQIKSNPELAIIPVVVLTTSKQDQDVLQSYHLGCNSYINKPVDVHEFFDMMHELTLRSCVLLPPTKGHHYGQPRPLTIVAVDDNPADFGILRRRLQRVSGLDCQLIHCDNAAAVHDVLDRSEVDCLFLDYQLGACTGLDVLTDIRASGNDVPVITLTGQGNEAIAVEAMKRGAQDYLVKADLLQKPFGSRLTTRWKKLLSPGR